MKLKSRLIQLHLIRRAVETLRNEEKEIKSDIDKHLNDKRTAMILLEREKSHLKPLFDCIENAEKNILQLKNIVQEKKIEYIVSKENNSYWQKKHDCASTSLKSAYEARKNNKRIIQELENELQQISDGLLESNDATQINIIELDDTEVPRARY